MTKKTYNYLSHILGKNFLFAVVAVGGIFIVVSGASNFFPLIYAELLEASMEGKLRIGWWAVWLGLALMVAALKQGLRATNAKQKLYATQTLLNTFTQELFREFPQHKERKSTQDYATLLHKTVEELLHLFSLDSLVGIIHVSSLIITVVIVCFLDWASAVATLVLMAVTYFAYQFGNNYYIAKDKILAKEKLAFLGDLTDTLNGSKTIAAFRANAKEEKRYFDYFTKVMNLSLKLRSVRFFIYFVLLDTAKTCYLLFVVWRGFSLATAGTLAVSQAIVLIYYSNMISTPIQYMNYLLEKLRTGWIAAELLMEAFPMTSRSPSKTIGEIEQIQFRNVGVCIQEKTILQNLDFTIQRGGHYHLSAPSGTGKTLILQLLTGYHREYQGEILVNNQPLEEIQLAEMAVLAQDGFLFRDTLGANICLSREENKEKIAELLTKMELPYAWDMQFDHNLSGGEKSRLLLARTLYADKPFVILDEPLVGVDHSCKLRILAYLKECLKDKTVLLVTHDPEVAQALTSQTIAIGVGATH